jgi:hypothetical protein
MVVFPFLSRGTLFTPKKLDQDRAKSIKDLIVQAPQFARPENSTEEEWIVCIMNESGYSLERMKKTVFERVKGEDESSRQKTCVRASG